MLSRVWDKWVERKNIRHNNQCISINEAKNKINILSATGICRENEKVKINSNNQGALIFESILLIFLVTLFFLSNWS